MREADLEKLVDETVEQANRFYHIEGLNKARDYTREVENILYLQSHYGQITKIEYMEILNKYRKGLHFDRA